MSNHVLLIGGVDSSGGAGLAQDVRALAQSGVRATLATTLVSAQTHDAMLTAEATPLALFKQQLQAAFAGDLPKAIKIGALANDAQLHLLIEILGDNPPVSVVWDPVQITSSNGVLGRLSHQAVGRLLPFITLLTPNTQELEWLAGMPVSKAMEALSAAHNLMAYGCAQVLLKGGHGSGLDDASSVTDVLYQPETSWSFTHAQRADFSLRGSGCLLAAAIAAAIANDYCVEDAVCIGEATVAAAFSAAEAVNEQTGVTTSLPVEIAPHHFPAVAQHLDSPGLRIQQAHRVSSAPAFAPLTHVQPGLYPVVDSLAWLQILLPLGIKIIQLRIKPTQGLSTAQISVIIAEAVKLAAHYDTMLFINDFWELAIEHKAYGVHLGQSDLAHADLVQIQQAGLRLGISTHGYAELCRARGLRPSYIALGHVYPTTTKSMPSAPQGPQRLAQYVELCEDLPTVAIGGINAENLAPVLAARVSSVAVVTAITRSDDPATSVRDFQRRIADAQQP